jgi:hypothetical protein
MREEQDDITVPSSTQNKHAQKHMYRLNACTNLDALDGDDVQVLGSGVVGAVHHRCHLQANCEHDVGGISDRETARCASFSGLLCTLQTHHKTALTGRPKDVRNLLPEVPPFLDIFTAAHEKGYIRISLRYQMHGALSPTHFSGVHILHSECCPRNVCKLFFCLFLRYQGTE